MLFVKVTSFLRAVWSLRLGIVPIAQSSARTAECLKCPEFDLTPKNEFCKACGCLRWTLADLRLKRLMPKIKCPKGKW